MAHINVDEDWYFDPRRQKLISVVGCRHKADGIVLELWFLAFRNAKNNFVISDSQADFLEHKDELMRCGLLKKCPGGYYASGSQVRGIWYKSKIENGKKGGNSSANKRRQQNQQLDSSEIQANASESNPNTNTNTNTNNKKQTYTTQQEGFDKPLSVSDKKSSPDHCVTFLEFWNSNRGPFAPIRKLNSKRRKQLLSFLKENKNSREWEEAICRAGRSPFLTGRNDRGWKMNFDYFIRPGNFDKILEGDFDSNTESNKKTLREIGL